MMMSAKAPAANRRPAIGLSLILRTATTVVTFCSFVWLCKMPAQAQFAAPSSAEICSGTEDTIEIAEACAAAGLAAIQRGDYRTAESDHWRSYAIRQSLLGPGNSDVLMAHSNFAADLHVEGLYAEAERLHRQIYDACVHALGAENPESLIVLSNLALDLHSQGRYAEAEQLDRQVYETRSRVIGAENPYTQSSLHNLAFDIRLEGRYADAEALDRQSYGNRMRLLGADHPLTLNSEKSVAADIRAQGRYAEAERLDRKTSDVFRRVLGAKHPDTLGSLENLAEDLTFESKYAEAETLLEETVSVQMTRGSESENPDAILYLGELGLLRTDHLHKYAEGYPDLKAAAHGTWERMRDMHVASSQEGARQILKSASWIFVGQIEGAWGWSHAR